MILLKCGKLYDGITNSLQEDMEILIEGNLIKDVGKKLALSDDTKIIDLSNLTITPGLIDAHVHMDIMDWKTWTFDKLTHSQRWFTLAALHTAKRTLHRGFTSIRCIGAVGASYGILEVKEAIEKGYFHGSRIRGACNGLGTTGSHGDLSQAWRLNEELSQYMMNKELNLGDGPDFFRAAVRREWKAGADLIKIVATGGFFTPNDSPEDQQLSDSELQAILETAKEVKIPVTAHAYSNEFMQKLINLGIQGIEHGSFMDEETAKMFEENNVYLVPTFSPYDEIINLNEENLSKKPKEFQDKLRKYADMLKSGRKVILNSNIKLGYGSDHVAVYNAYDCGYEYVSLMNSGMDPFRILQSATKNNAEILGLKDVGTIEAGKLADIAAWSRDLLTDPKALLDCSFVMKDGVVYEGEKTE